MLADDLASLAKDKQGARQMLGKPLYETVEKPMLWISYKTQNTCYIYTADTENAM